MDVREAWIKTTGTTKTACAKVADSAKNVADELSPPFAPLAKAWDAEAGRRDQLRTPENLKALLKAQKDHAKANSTLSTAQSNKKTADSTSKNPIGKARRAARKARKAARGEVRSTKAELKEAAANYPQTLAALATKVHATHTIASGVTSYALSNAQDWTTWPAFSSAALIALNVGGLWLGRRTVTVEMDEGMSAYERRIAGRLDPSYWGKNADIRKLSGTVPTEAKLTPAGLESHVRLDAPWTPATFKAKLADIRTFLGLRSETRMEIRTGTHDDRALILVRTRSAADGVPKLWTPDHVGIGVDTITGEFVDVPKDGTHKLVAGATNMGKSFSWRTWMMQVAHDPLWSGILLDPKMQEAQKWYGKIRTEGHQRSGVDEIRQAIYDALCELVEEMRHRQQIAKSTSWDPTPEYPNLLVVIEEGRQLIQMSQDKRWGDVLNKVDDLYTLARAVGIWLVWATQYPSRTNGGITANVSENSLTVVSLTVGSATSDRVVFGEDAATTGWEPSKLGGEPGLALVQHKGLKPHPVQLWLVTDEMIEALPNVKPWSRTQDGPQRPTGLTLVKGEGQQEEHPAAPAADTNAGKVLRAIQGGATTNKAVEQATEINKGTVSKAIKALIADGLVERSGGVLTARAGEEGAA